MNTKNVIYFDCYGTEHVSKEIKKVIRNKNMVTVISRIQAHDSIMCE